MEALYAQGTQTGRPEGRWCSLSGAITLVCLACLQVSHAHGAGYKTTNFTVDAPTPQMARQIGEAAEYYRREMAQQWLGRELPPWSHACPIKARVSPQLGAGGLTSFIFDQGTVSGWRMEIQGSFQRILDSVLPHEVTHTIFASHFRRPLPRWADEGACTTVEHQSEISKQETNLIRYLQTGKGIRFSTMFALVDYPQDVLPLYAQGHSLTKFLIAQRGKRAFINFLGKGMQDGAWPRAVHQAYGYRNLHSLQKDWMRWIRQGRPEIQPVAGTTLAVNTTGQIFHRQDTGSQLLAHSPFSPRNSPTKTTVPAENEGLTMVTKPWTGVEASQDPANLPSTTDITWPETSSNPANRRPAKNTFTSTHPRNSIYDATRKRGTMYR
ncbi:MAG: hypothetical protein ABGX16_22930 [Pirellulales bacterium]